MTNPHVLTVVRFSEPTESKVNTTPRIIGLMGVAGSGKDTVARLIKANLQAETIALADPMKEFAQKVFGFSDEQLRGASELRNAPDKRLSLPAPPKTGNKFGDRLKAWFRHNLLQKPDPSFDHHFRIASKNRKVAQDSFAINALPWLKTVIPQGYDMSAAAFELKKWMAKTMTHRQITPRMVLQTLGTDFGRSVSDDIWIRIALERASKVICKGRVAIITDIRFINEAKALRESGHEVWAIRRPAMASQDTVSSHASEKEQNSPIMEVFVSRTVYNGSGLAELATTVRENLLVDDRS